MLYGLFLYLISYTLFLIFDYFFQYPYYFGIKLGSGIIFQLPYGCLVANCSFIRTVAGHYIIGIHYRYYPGQQGYFLTLFPQRVAPAIPALMMSQYIFTDVR